MGNTTQLRGINMCTTEGLLTCTGAETLFDTTVAIAFCNDGKSDLHATEGSTATPATDNFGNAYPSLKVTNADGSLTGKGACVVWGLTGVDHADGVDTIVILHGEVQELDGLTTNFVIAPQFPDIPDDVTPFAYQILKAATDGSTADATVFATANWNATRFTNVIVDVFTLPRRPQES